MGKEDLIMWDEPLIIGIPIEIESDDDDDE